MVYCGDMRCAPFGLWNPLNVCLLVGCGLSGPPAGGPDDTAGSADSSTTTAASEAVTTTSVGAGGAGGMVSPTGASSSSGQGGHGPSPDFQCVADSGVATLIDAAQMSVASYADTGECQQALDNMGESVVCAWFTPGMPIGPDAWDETGWRPMNVATLIGLGRRPHLSFQDCLDATQNARGGVVCTNTGVGYKSAHIETNKWCGASSNLLYCTEASLAARNFHVCSFPSDGDGSGPGWVLTEIAGTTCNYISSQMPLSQCNAMIP